MAAVDSSFQNSQNRSMENEDKSEKEETDSINAGDETGNNESDIKETQQSSGMEKVVTCGLCKKWLTKPRVLPCMHSFCEHCLSAYVLDKLPAKFEDIEEKQHFHCAICRYKIVIQDASIAKELWITTFPVHSVLVTLIQNLRVQHASKCDPCDRGGQRTDATTWCRECGEALCAECANYHGRAKILMEHSLFSLEEVRNQAAKLADVTEICAKHSCKKVEALCLSHEELCCVDCLTYIHKDCNPVRPITDISRNIKQSKFVMDIFERLKEADRHVSNAVDHRRWNIDELKKQHIEIMKNIGRLKEEIHEQIETLESKLKQEFGIMHEALLEKVNEQKQEFLNRHFSLYNGSQVLNASIEHGTDDNVLVTAHKLRKLCQEHERYIKTESRNLRRHDYSVIISNKVQSFTKDVSSLADITTKTEPTDIIPAFMKDMVAVETGEINGRVASDSEHPWFTSGTFLANGNLVLVDFRNKKVKCFDMNQDLVSELFVDGQPWGICEFGPNELLLTIPEKSEILKVNVVDDALLELSEEAIKAVQGCHDVRMFTDHIFAACSNEIVLLTTTGKVERIIPVPDRGARYVYPRTGSKLCYTTNTAFVCRNDNGISEFDFTDKDLRSPRGVARDKEGNFYVCGMDSNNVFQLSPTGQLCKVLLTSSQSGIKNPYAIGFEPNKTQFFLTQMDCDTVKIYRMITRW